MDEISYEEYGKLVIESEILKHRINEMRAKIIYKALSQQRKTTEEK